MSDTKKLSTIAYTEYVKKARENNTMLRVLISHLISVHIIDTIIEEKCPEGKKIVKNHNQYTDDIKLTLLHCMRIIPDRLYYDLKELNSFRNSYAHNLELKKASFKFYGLGDSDPPQTYSNTDPNFKNNIEWLCDDVVVSLTSLAIELGIDTKYPK